MLWLKNIERIRRQLLLHRVSWQQQTSTLSLIRYTNVRQRIRLESTAGISIGDCMSSDRWEPSHVAHAIRRSTFAHLPTLSLHSAYIFPSEFLSRLNSTQSEKTHCGVCTVISWSNDFDGSEIGVTRVVEKAGYVSNMPSRNTNVSCQSNTP